MIRGVTWVVVAVASVGAGMAIIVGSGGSFAGPPRNLSAVEAR